MLVDGATVQSKNIVTFSDELALDPQDQVQPNGIDLRVKTIYRVHGKALIPREGKAQADFVVQELPLKDGYWTLEARDQALFYVDFFESIHCLDGYSAHLHTRSSLVRAGVDVVGGWWDTGFRGPLGCTLRVHQDITIEYGAKLCQVIVWESKFNGSRYNGRYQGKGQTSIVAS